MRQPCVTPVFCMLASQGQKRALVLTYSGKGHATCCRMTVRVCVNGNGEGRLDQSRTIVAERRGITQTCATSRHREISPTSRRIARGLLASRTS